MNTTRILRRTLAAVGLAAAAGLAAHFPALAHEGHHHNAMGTVHAVEAAQLQLETKDGKIETFLLTDSTSFKRGDAAARREDVKVGERAVVMFEVEDGKQVAIEIKLAASGHQGHDGHGSHADEPSSPPASTAAASLEMKGAELLGRRD